MDYSRLTSNVKIYIGYDKKESIAFDVCKHSIEKVSDIEVVRLSTETIDGYSRKISEPQSTDFTFSRFWIPSIEQFEGISIYCDCDFLFLEDPLKILSNIDLNNHVSVVKHPNYIPNSFLKMDNKKQNFYERKNWSSLMVFNNQSCKILDKNYLINHMPGIDLHTFEWTNKIGEISLEWNCLDNYYNLDNPKAIHYTDGGPWFENYQDTQYSELWKQMYVNLQKRYEQ